MTPDRQGVHPKEDPGLTPNEMKAFVKKHFDDFVNKKKSDVALKNFSSDFLDHDGPRGATVGPAASKGMMEGMYKIWPDIHVEVEDIISEGDKVMVRNKWRGTSKTGKKIEFHGFVLWRFAKGTIVERWATITSPEDDTDEKW
jgi:predicted ester cyclase